ncbi:outer membrane protein [Occallatibacter riparius]|uniref:Acyloxyacyl hydrolase n=1 Tax=Occallatibacter riparius TaxID=1002689 RepID=A0A9J7BYL3_9BACT|nr:acyloxyacyl hydrolase [Occallatibacter riparius]UWZ86398.1 acyloxyacyl hydrolase [Occallatibacter riparius]
MTVTVCAHRFAWLAMLALVVCSGAGAAQEPASLSQASPAVKPPVAQSADPANSSSGSAPSDPQPAPKSAMLVSPVPTVKRPDFNRNIYYKNKLEFSLETGWLPNNIPFVFDFIVGSKYNSWPLHYTLVPNIASVRWQLDNIWGWKLFRGNTDFSFSGSYTAIPRGAETRYFAFDYGIRRNFIPSRWRVVPYVEGRGGIGNINAKQPHGVYYSQGQDMTFTLMVGSGARYNFGPRYAVSGGATYMHVSNFYLSEPRYEDFGINVYGAIVGVYMRIGKPKADLIR